MRAAGRRLTPDRPSPAAGGTEPYRSFYDQRRGATYGRAYTETTAEKHSCGGELREFLRRYGLEGARCLEIGSSGGAFQDFVDDYWATDVAEGLRQYYHKPYRVCSGGRFPFDDGTFDCIWTIHVFEHIPELQTAMEEIGRLVKPGGYVFFAPAWQCRPWAADGYAVRPYADFPLRGKVIKLLIPLRNSVAWRALTVLPLRVLRRAAFALGKRYAQLPYRRLTPNYETFWTSDSDACNSIEGHDAILWFLSNGFQCLSHPTAWRALAFRNGPLVFRKRGG